MCHVLSTHETGTEDIHKNTMIPDFKALISRWGWQGISSYNSSNIVRQEQEEEALIEEKRSEQPA